VNKVFFKRCFAWFVDWLLSCLPCLLYILLCSPSLDRPTVTDLLGLFVFVPATCILFVLRDVIWKGRSLGKRIFRLHIIGLPSMTPATNEKKMMRNLLFFLFPIDFFLLLTTHQTIGDRFAGTFVVMKTE